MVSGKYDSIMDMPHYQSKKRPHMSNYDRAAQFSPFAALTGYEAAVAEAGLMMEAVERLELSEERAQFLDSRLGLIREHLAEQPEIEVTFFKQNDKNCGSYVQISGRLKRIDEQERKLILTDRTEIQLEDIFNIESELLN